MNRILLVLFIVTFVFITIIQSSMAENVCVVNDPTNTQLNVRSAPWGNIIGTLPNGFEVDIIDIKHDKKGSAWAQVSGLYKGKNQIIGWVFQDYLACNPVEDSPGEAACTVADPTGTPLNIRESPDGEKLGTLNNGIEVYIVDIHKDKKNNVWAKVGRYVDNHFQEIGWVFKNYLSCPEY
ncbi:MAG: SH3 domain-containing protein [Cyanobacteriota bacterium]